MIKIGIFGYGNLARGVEAAIKKNDDFELVAVFTRIDASKVQINTKGVNVYNVKDVLLFKDKIKYMGHRWTRKDQKYYTSFLQRSTCSYIHVRCN